MNITGTSLPVGKDAAPRRPRIAVFGLGYVGSVSAACLSDAGFQVVGIDVNEDKVDAVLAGEATVGEPRLGSLMCAGLREGRLTATTSARDAVRATDLALVCVGTPSDSAGRVSLSAVERVAEDIGSALATLGRWYTVVVRSTVPPGTIHDLVMPAIERASGLVAGRDFGIAVNPEFLREGSAVEDFRCPPKTVVGSDDQATAALVASLYEALPGPVFLTPVKVAEAIKYADNSFHALKVSFANEVGELCAALGIDSHEVFDIVRADTKLNASGAYLRPGYAFGGSCLPKDLRTLLHTARHADVAMPMLERVLQSNARQVERAFEVVIASGATRVGLFGLAFKFGTDDLRESPMVELAERLLGKGLELRIHDAAVDEARLHGANRAFIERHLPHLSQVMAPTVSDLAGWAEACVVASANDEVAAALLERHDLKVLLDLNRGKHSEALRQHAGYRGASW